MSDSEQSSRPSASLAIRSHTGLSGDILLAGLAALCLEINGIAPDSDAADRYLGELAAAVFPALSGCLTLRPHVVGGIRGWQAQIDLPHEHVHRHLAEIQEIVGASGLSPDARARAESCFSLLARCEAAAHGIDVSEVHFHEVGALDSILDICAVCELHNRLGSPAIVCSPLPVADGVIACAHGLLPAPAPAALRLLQGFAVRPFAGGANAGELLTPTALALLHTLAACFGPWPAMTVEATCLAYGQREFAATANGVIFALGKNTV